MIWALSIYKGIVIAVSTSTIIIIFCPYCEALNCTHPFQSFTQGCAVTEGTIVAYQEWNFISNIDFAAVDGALLHLHIQITCECTAAEGHVLPKALAIAGGRFKAEVNY